MRSCGQTDQCHMATAIVVKDNPGRIAERSTSSRPVRVPANLADEVNGEPSPRAAVTVWRRVNTLQPRAKGCVQVALLERSQDCR